VSTKHLLFAFCEKIDYLKAETSLHIKVYCDYWMVVALQLTFSLNLQYEKLNYLQYVFGLHLDFSFSILCCFRMHFKI